MISEEQDFDEDYKRSCWIGYLTSSSVIFYGLIAYYILSYTSVRGPFVEDVSFIKSVFCGIGLSIAVCIGVLHRIAMIKIRDAALGEQGTIKYLQTLSMVSFGLCESIGILGVVLVMITRNMSDYYGLAFLSLITFSLSFPKYHRWKQVLQQSCPSDV